MKRGDVVIVALPGDLGKPRPALVLQSDLYTETSSVTVVPITSTIIAGSSVRVSLQPTRENGLRDASQIMTDKVTTVPRSKIGQVAGAVDETTMQSLTSRLALFLGFV